MTHAEDASGHMAMGPGREFDTIRRLMDRWGALAVGIGDDAALLHAPSGRTLVASTDAFVENAHFREGWISPSEIGARATAAALSDLAAMGARADSVLIAFVVPDGWRARLLDVADGIARVLGPTGARIAGGNMSSGAEFSITTTVIGSAARVIPRSGARPGDILMLTGALGGPGVALRAFDDGVEPPTWARDRFAAPEPRLLAGQAFAAAGAHAMLDISDGLAADARHLAAASRVSLRIDAGRVPRGPGVTIPEALTSGEEYELLVAVPPSIVSELLTTVPERCGVAVSVVGDVEDGGHASSDDDGAERRVVPAGSVRILGLTDATTRVEFTGGHDHFSR